MFLFFEFLTPTRPSLVMAATKLAHNILLLLEKAFYTALDFESVKMTWSEMKKPLPFCWIIPRCVHTVCVIFVSSVMACVIIQCTI